MVKNEELGFMEVENKVKFKKKERLRLLASYGSHLQKPIMKRGT